MLNQLAKLIQTQSEDLTGNAVDDYCFVYPNYINMPPRVGRPG